jgi:hypothetical protein
MRLALLRATPAGFGAVRSLPKHLSLAEGDADMPRLNSVDPASATGKTKELLDLVQQRTGRIPNMVRLMAAPEIDFPAVNSSSAIG